MTERVTVIIPAFKATAIIADAIGCALSQTETCRVIVVDDASGDGTVATARACDDGTGRLTVIEQPINRGPAAARNIAIRAAETEWIALLDADDRMESGRVAALLEIADAEGWDFVADDLKRVSDWDAVDDYKRLWSDADFGQFQLHLAGFVHQNIYTYCGHGRELGYIKPLMRRKTVLANALFYNENMRLGEDFDLYARALIAGVAFGLTDPLGYYAFDTPGSLSKMHKGRDLKAAYLASKALVQTPGLSRPERAVLREHMTLCHKKWAWVRLIEAVRARNVGSATGAFMAPLPVIGELLGRIGSHFRPPSQPEPDGAVRAR